MVTTISWLLVACAVGGTDGYTRISPSWQTRQQSTSILMSYSEVKYLPSALLVQGPVATGYGRGSKKLGVPTANLPHFDAEIRTASLLNGVYLGWAMLPKEGQILACVANIGKSPTFVNQENPVNIIEAHLLDRNFEIAGDFYGSSLKLCLVAFLREEKKFASFDALVAQINADIAQTRELTTTLTTNELQAGKRIATEFFARKTTESSEPEQVRVWEQMKLL